MSDWRRDVEDARSSFLVEAELAGDPISRDEIEVEFLDAPHEAPRRLPAGKMAILGFWSDGIWLKIGMAGPKSNARYTSQHYGVRRAPSTLAKSLVNDPNMFRVAGFDPLTPGAWIKATTHRVNILLPSEKGTALLKRLKATLLSRLNPRYEGKFADILPKPVSK